MALVFDIETNGLLRQMTKIHSLVIYDTERKELISCSDSEQDKATLFDIDLGVKLLQEADCIVGHNIVKFDIPAIQKIYPQFNPKGKIFDTMLVSKLCFPDIGQIDDKWIKRGLLPKALRGRYNLESWGYRLKEYKGDYCKQEDCWAYWSSEMQRYCEQDVKVTTKLYKLLLSKKVPENVIELEQKFAKIIGLQEQRGVKFDKESAIDITAKLIQEKSNLEEKLKEAFPPEVIETTFIPKVNNRNKGYVKGQPYVKRKVVEFNPASRQQVVKRLQDKYNWQPTKLTDKGNPKIDEEVLEGLKYPEATLLKDYFDVNKLLGQLTEGNNAWLKLEEHGIIYGKVDTIGAVTCRCTHNKPNLAQVPSVKSFMGKECRSLFQAREGFNLVGCDASGLELRCLAHYMGDDEYTHEILNGDIHTKNQLAAGLPTRDDAKTFIYGYIYGAGDEKVGQIIGKGKQAGAKIKQKFLKEIPKLGKLIEGVKARIKQKGYLKGIDKRILTVREQYKGLNVLLQSAGAIVMKQALCVLYQDCVNKGWIEDRWYLSDENKVYFVLNIHDEYQAEVKPEIVEEYKVMAVEAIRKAGDLMGFRCPLDGEAKVGKNWYDTH